MHLRLCTLLPELERASTRKPNTRKSQISYFDFEYRCLIDEIYTWKRKQKPGSRHFHSTYMSAWQKVNLGS
jgi:hypothetical protein